MMDPNQVSNQRQTSMPKKDELCDLSVVIPVYNEEGTIADVVREWRELLDGLGINYELLVLNDGSRDHTEAILSALDKDFAQLKVVTKANSGHGPTILQGYRMTRGRWVFQTDSDRELSPEPFRSLWAKRDAFDYLQGYRVNRVASLSRKLTTIIARWMVLCLFGSGLRDVNCPYRLMNGEWTRRATVDMPDNTLTPNIVLSGWAIRDRLSIHEEAVEHYCRRTGPVSIRRWKLLRFALKAFVQVLRLRTRAKES